MSSNSLSVTPNLRLPSGDLPLQDEAEAGDGGAGGGSSGDDDAPFPRETMNKLILNYFVTEGFREAAEKFKEESSLTCDIDFRTLEDRIKIRDAVQNGDIMEATNLVHEHHPELLDDDKPLHFQLQRQHLIELIRQGRIDDALSYSSDHLAERGEEEFGMLEELEKTLVLLAFDDPSRSPFADLMSELHRQKVASDLNSAILKAQHAETSEPKLATALKLLHWAQDQLEKENAKFNKVTNLVTSNIEEAKP